MNSHLLRACTLFVIAALPACSYAADTGPSVDQLRKELGINAVLTTYYSVAIQKRIEEGKPEEARELIDAEYIVLLPVLRRYDSDIATERTVLELRDRIVKYLQTRWLVHPPTYLDKGSAEYLERTCATIPGCPKGRVHPLKEAVLPPTE